MAQHEVSEFERWIKIQENREKAAKLGADALLKDLNANLVDKLLHTRDRNYNNKDLETSVIEEFSKSYARNVSPETFTQNLLNKLNEESKKAAAIGVTNQLPVNRDFGKRMAELIVEKSNITLQKREEIIGSKVSSYGIADSPVRDGRLSTDKFSKGTIKEQLQGRDLVGISSIREWLEDNEEEIYKNLGGYDWPHILGSDYNKDRLGIAIFKACMGEIPQTVAGLQSFQAAMASNGTLHGRVASKGCLHLRVVNSLRIKHGRDGKSSLVTDIAPEVAKLLRTNPGNAIGPKGDKGDKGADVSPEDVVKSIVDNKEKLMKVTDVVAEKETLQQNVKDLLNQDTNFKSAVKGERGERCEQGHGKGRY